MALQSNCIIRSCYRVESRGKPPPKYRLPLSLCRKTVVGSPDLGPAKYVLLFGFSAEPFFINFVIGTIVAQRFQRTVHFLTQLVAAFREGDTVVLRFQ